MAEYALSSGQHLSDTRSLEDHLGRLCDQIEPDAIRLSRQPRCAVESACVTPNREPAGREHGDLCPLESDDASGVLPATAKELFAQFERAFAAPGGDAVRRAALMVAIADAMAAHGRVPGSLVPVVEDVVAAWKTAGHVPDADLLLRANVTVWAALQEKNGNSTTIADIIDRTLRAFLCLTEVVRLDEAMDYAGWAAEMLSTEEWPRPLMSF